MKRHLQHRLKFRHLRVIDAIVSHDSILQAAKSLGLSQPALTKSLHEIEEVIGARLFERHPRGVTPNPHGLAIAESARRILVEVNRLEDALEVLDGGDGGAVAVGALPVTAAGLLPGALARFQAQRPDIEVRVIQGRTEELLAALAVRDIDCILGRLYEPPQPDSFVREAFYEEPIAALARADHPIFASAKVAASDIAAYNLVLPTISQRIGREIDAFLAEIGVSPRQPLRSSSVALIRETLHATDSIAVIPRAMLVGDVLRRAIRVIDLPVSSWPRPAGLIKRSDAPLLKNASAFLEVFKTYVQDVKKQMTP